MSRLAPALAALLLFAFLPPAAAQSLPAPVGSAEPVASWSLFQSPMTSCTSWEPTLGLFDVGLGSFVDTAPVAGGTRYTIHLTTLMPQAGCPSAVDLEFESSLVAWPSPEQAWTSGDVRSPCGATGYFSVYAHEQGRILQLSLQVPEACAAGLVGAFYIGVSLQPLQPSEHMLCAPVALPLSCAGVSEREEPYAPPCASGHSAGATTVVPVLTVRRECWYEERVRVSDSVLGVSYVEVKEDACTVHVDDPFLGVVSEDVACPAEVGAVIFGVEWGRALP